MRCTGSVTFALAGLLVCASAMEGCGKIGNAPADSQLAAAASATSSSVVPAEAPPPAPSAQASYTPPTAAQLIQLLAPIAAFPDSLVAQVLAASSYPDQVGAAYTWSTQNPNLKEAALQQALDGQPWDPSVKAIIAFPDVLHQMASNVSWMTALGEAYVNDPTDVMNGIQALRQQALACGNLKSNNYVRVTKVPKQAVAPAPATATPTAGELSYLGSDESQTYSGPAVIPAPAQVIEIAPADPNVVYVPRYDPAVFYGSPIVSFPGYAYAWPAPVYSGPAFGGWGFGLGISVGFGFGHPWGWGAWGLHWGPGFGFPRYGFGFHAPAVVFNNHVYVSHSTTVINHFAAGNPRSFANGGNEPRAFGPRASTPTSFPSSRPTSMAANHPGSTNFSQMTTPRFTNATAASPQARQSSVNTGSRVAATTSGGTAGSSRTMSHGATNLHSSHYTSPIARNATPTSTRSFAQASNRGNAGHPVGSRTSTSHPVAANSRNSAHSSVSHANVSSTSRTSTPTNTNSRSLQRVAQSHSNSAPHNSSASGLSGNKGQRYASAQPARVASASHGTPQSSHASAPSQKESHRQ